MSKDRHIENTIPILPVKSLTDSIRFYTEKLDFELLWSTDIVGSVGKGGHHIMLQQRDTSFEPGWVWIGMQDDVLFDGYQAKGVKVIQEPQNHAWAYEVKFADPDGNILWDATGPKKDIPFE